MSTRGKVFIIIGFIALFFLGLMYYISSLFTSGVRNVNISDNTILEIPLLGNVEDRAREQGSFLGKFTGPSMNGLSKSFKMAARDDRIKAVLVNPNFLSGAGFGKIQEIGKMISGFREESGKKVYAYIEVCGTKEYYLASFCDSVFAVPTGMLLVKGLAGSIYYIKEGLNKLGISADFISIGKYKNAPEMYTRKNFSEDQKEVLNDLLDQYYDELVRTIAENRKLSVEKVKSLLDIGYFTSETALSYGMIDGLRYKKEIWDNLEAINGKIRKVDYPNYIRQDMDKFYPSGNNQIAVVYAQGVIYLGRGDLEGNILSESFVDMIYKIKKNKKIKAVVLRIDSPGGSGTASEVVYNALKDLRKEKPLIVSVADMAASGGYYMAMAGDSIIAESGSIVGSIGVYGGKFSFGGLYNKLGINKEILTRGKNATIFNEEQKFTPSERQVITEGMEAFYSTFVAKVAMERQKSWDEIHDIAQGRVWTGADGVQNGLVDKIGTLEDAILSARKAVGFLDRENVSVVYYPGLRPVFEKLLQRFNIETRRTDLINDLLKDYPPGNYFMKFSRFNSYEILAILPWYMEVK